MKLSKDRLSPIRELWTKKSANTLESHLNFWTSQIGVNSRPEDRIRGVTWNAQKRMWKRNLSCDGICIFFEMPQNRRCSFSVHFLFSESNGKNLIDHVLFFRNAPLFYARFFWNAPFFPFDSENRKWTENEHLRFWGISKKNAYAITW